MAARASVKAASAASRRALQPSTLNQALIKDIRNRLAANANPVNAGPMQAYMKSSLPFYGITATLRRKLIRDAVEEFPCSNVDVLKATMESLWRSARYREEWYAAQELPRMGKHRKLPLLPLLTLYGEMISGTAWWDCCDDISGNVLPKLLQEHPTKLKPLLRQWAQGDDLWLRRAAILAQRRLKHALDSKLFYECIEFSLADERFNREFFITKGIGWALRDRSYNAPEEVTAYCEKNAHRMAPLTHREALKAMKRRAEKAEEAVDEEEDKSD